MILLDKIFRETGYYCAFCNKYKPYESVQYEDDGIGICKDCMSEIKFFPFTPLSSNIKYAGTVMAVSAYTGKLRDTLHRYKFNNNPAYSKVLSYIAIKYLEEFEKGFRYSLFSNIDMIIPVPLSKRRQNERGYNQSELLAENISLHFRVLCNTSSLIKIKHNRKQSATPHFLRNQNVKNVYFAQEHEIKDKSILLLDDILTTGSTVAECSKTLANAGAKNISIFTLTNSKKHYTTNEYTKLIKNVYKTK